MAKKLLIVVQDISKAQEHEWFVKYIDRKLFDIYFLLINGKGTIMEKFLVDNNVPYFLDTYKGKKHLPRLTFNIFRLIRRVKFDIVHTHLFEASLCGITAAFLAGIKLRIYTRHHSDYHHVWHPSAVKYDKYINYMSRFIIAISNNVRNILILKEKAPEKKVLLIHHGIDMKDYEPGAVSAERIIGIRNRYDLHESSVVIGAISRFTEWKGLQFLIPAFKELLTEFPDAILVLANAKGDFKNQILEALQSIDEKNYRLITFENDIAALYKVFNCFVHIPVSETAEAFGQTYLEALASRVPSVFTVSGVAAEFIINMQHALIVPYKDSSAVKEAILFILKNKPESARMTEEGYNIVKEKFDIHVKIRKLQQLYNTSL